MNKFAKKIHNQFITGQISSPIYSYMQKIALSIPDVDLELFDKHIQELSILNVQSVDDCEQYFKIITAAPKAYELLTLHHLRENSAQDLCAYAFKNRKQYNFQTNNQFSKLALDYLKAHPNNYGIEGDAPPQPPYNLDKWIETMRYIYDTANANNLPLSDVSKRATAKWEENERIHFERWMQYYEEGNYNKYNVKTAQFFVNKQELNEKSNANDVKDMFDTSAFPKLDPVAEKKKKLDDARKKLRGRLKSVLELLDQYRDVLPRQDNDVMRKSVYDLNERVWNLELKASIVDSIIRTSNQLNKYGFAEGATELKKIAQEVAQDKLPEVPEQKQPKEVVETPKEKAPVPDVNTNTNVPEVNIENIEIPNFNSATHGDALRKLEEINEVLSKRSLVRALASIDIILGQLGIASYFPALSESQSKLLDAFNYSATRIADVISQLRGGISANKDKKEEPETVEVAEEVEKPVGNVMTGAPQSTQKSPEVK